MAHTLGGYTLYVTEDEPEHPAIAAELEVLDSTSTTIQHFSKPSVRRNLTAYIVGTATYNNIVALTSGSAVANYTNDVASQGNFYVLSVQARRQRGTPIGFGGAASTDPIWLASIKMIAA